MWAQPQKTRQLIEIVTFILNQSGHVMAISIPRWTPTSISIANPTPKSSFSVFSSISSSIFEFPLHFQLHWALKICISFGFGLMRGRNAAAAMSCRYNDDLTLLIRPANRKSLFGESAISLPIRLRQILQMPIVNLLLLEKSALEKVIDN